ncbi:response regulator [Leadbetterella sp. DM7]|uniref:response regulator n=1 Tax=Leadbetterella sp. DM7 TaxID=3235085 RepID=UPI00349E9536
MATKVLLYEDNAELRASLSSLIAFSEELELAAAFENCSGVLEHLRTYQPDIVLTDIDMPVVNGIKGLEMIRSVNPDLPVIMLTVFDDNQHILDAIMNGATGYILKQHLTTRLGNAISEALHGGAPMSPVVAQLVLKHISSRKDRKTRYALTLREKDILQSLTDGNSYKMIAANLGITQGTVCTHIKSIYEKLGVHSQAEAVSKTLKEGIL